MVSPGFSMVGSDVSIFSFARLNIAQGYAGLLMRVAWI
jgi:hypothetical protein